MKVINRYSKLLLVPCFLFLVPAMVLAEQANWNDIPGGKIVDGKYQIKCGEGSGWQKCGESEPKEECKLDISSMDTLTMASRYFCHPWKVCGVYKTKIFWDGKYVGIDTDNTKQSRMRAGGYQYYFPSSPKEKPSSNPLYGKDLVVTGYYGLGQNRSNTGTYDEICRRPL